MGAIRPAAVAGSFYPDDPRTLAGAVAVYLGAAGPADPVAPKALIVPHAGYVYSGPIAASAYALLAPARDTIRRIILLGPAHRVPMQGLALPGASAFSTPLGTVEIDAEAAALALTLPQVSTNDAAHDFEHSLEVQLPFLQSVLAEFKIVPFVVGQTSGTTVAEVIDLLWGGPETLIVVSSDLSHYHAYAAAREMDRGTVQQITAFDPSLDHNQACGATPINGLLRCAAQHRLTARLLDVRNSGDTAGDRSRVVGYAALAFAGDERERH